MQLTSNVVSRKTRHNVKDPSLLAGRVFDATGQSLRPTHAMKAGKRYRYNVSKDALELEAPSWRLPATEFEASARTAL